MDGPKVQIEITAKNDKLTQDLNQAKGQLEGFVNNGVSSLQKLAGAIGVGFAIHEIIGDIQEATEHIKHLSEEAEKFQMPIEALQKFQYQASLVGLSGDDISNSFKFMERNVAQAAEGTGTATKAFAQLGIDAKYIKDLSPEQQFKAIGDAMNGVTNTSDRVNIAMQIFGRQGSQVLNLLKEDLSKTSTEFDKLGIAITKPQAEAVSAFANQEIKLKAIWDGVKNQMTADVAPAFTFVGREVEIFIANLGGAKVIGGEMASAILTGIKYIVEGFQVATNAVKLFSIGIDGLKSGIRDVAILSAASIDSLGKLGQGIGKSIYTGNISDITSGFSKENNPAKIAIDAIMAESDKTTKKQSDTFNDIATSNQNNAITRSIAAIEAQIKATDKNTIALEGGPKSLEQLAGTPGYTMLDVLKGTVGQVPEQKVDTVARDLKLTQILQDQAYNQAYGKGTGQGFGTIKNESTGQVISIGNVPGGDNFTGKSYGNQKSFGTGDLTDYVGKYQHGVDANGHPMFDNLHDTNGNPLTQNQNIAGKQTTINVVVSAAPGLAAQVLQDPVAKQIVQNYTNQNTYSAYNADQGLGLGGL